jgi:DNA invertase Pin-like site-specific DNA recombinase
VGRVAEQVACRNGDTLVFATLDRLASPVTDAKDIVDKLTITGVKLSISGSVRDTIGS